MTSHLGRIALFVAVLGMFTAALAGLCIDSDDSSAEGETFTQDGIVYTFKGASFVITGYTPDISPTISLGNVLRPGDEQPTPVDTVDSNAFRNCVKIKSVTFTSDIYTVGNNAFENCMNLETVIFADDHQMNAIGDYAFKDCVKITDISIRSESTPEERRGQGPDLGTGCFWGCESLVQASVSKYCSIEECAFAGCSSLEGVRWVGMDEISDYGVVYRDFSSNNPELVCYPAKLQGDTYTCPELMISILDRAFEGTQYLKTVILPVDIKNIAIPNDTGSVYGAFTDCLSLESFAFPDESQGTYYCIDAGVLMDKDKRTVIRCPGGMSFEDDKYVFPGTVTQIVNKAFYGCIKLKTIDFTENNPQVTLIGKYAFSKSGITRLDLPTIQGGGEIAVGNYAFQGCESLTGAGLGSSCKRISDYMFSGCIKLNNLGMTSVLETIGSHAFSGCTSLTEVQIPASVSVIDSAVFENCSSLVAITVEDTNPEYTAEDGVLFKKTKDVLIQYPMAKTTSSYTIVDAVTSIETRAFSGNTHLVSLKIGTSLRSIGDEAFYGCESLFEVINTSDYLYGKLERGSTEYGYIAFYVREGLLKEQGESSVYNVDLTDVGDCCFIKGTRDVLVKYNGTKSEITLPESFVDPTTREVTSYLVGLNAFLDNTRIIKVTLSSGIFAFEDNAFVSCPNLEYIDIGTYTGSIDNRVFSDCPKFMTVIADNDLYHADDNGVLFSKSGGEDTTLVLYPSAKTETQYIIGAPTVGPYAFYNNISLTTVTLRPTTLVLGDHAFDGCTGLTFVLIPITVETVGEDVYANCTSITRIQMPLRLDARIFSGCTGLTEIIFTGETDDYFDYSAEQAEETPWYLSNDSSISVVFDEGLVTVGGYMFSGCTGIVSVTFPSTMESIGPNVFSGNTNFVRLNLPITMNASNMAGCTTLQRIDFTAGDDGVGFDYDSTSCLTTPWYHSMENSPELFFDTEITKIGNYMFYGYCGAETFIMPDPIVEIGDYSFFACETTSFKFNAGSSLVKIGTHAISSCPNLTGQIVLPGNLQEIAPLAFDNNHSLTGVVIPSSLRTFGAGAFNGCNNVTLYTIPVTIDATNITDSFDTIVTIRLTGGSDSTGEPSGVSFTYTESTCANTLWRKSANLNTISIDEGVTTISTYMFYGTERLERVIMPESLVEVSEKAFMNCSNLEMIGLQPTLSTIGPSAFENCSSLTEFTVPDGIENIGKDAFKGCSSITNLTIPVSMSGTIFSDCESLTNVSMTKGNGHGVDYDSTNYMDLPWYRSRDTFVIMTFDPGVTHIGAYVAYNCYNLSTVNFADSIVSIGDSAFGGTGLAGEVNLPENIVSIGKDSFSGCSGITSLSLPESLQSIGSGAFSGCMNIDSLQFPIYLDATAFNGCFNGPETVKTVFLQAGTGDSKGIGYNYTSENCYLLPWMGCGSVMLSIGSDIKTIGDYMFSGCGAIPMLTIPESVEYIGSHAFNECNGITEIQIANEGNEFVIGEYAFASNGQLSLFSLPDRVTEIGANAFQGCYSLNLFTINTTSSLESIGEYAFANTSIESIYIPSAITDIKAYTFSFSNLGTINFARLDSLLRIEEHAFEGNQIASFTVPNTISYIGKYAFSNCSYLSTLTIPVDTDLTCLCGVQNLNNIIFTEGRNGGRGLDYLESGARCYTDLIWNDPRYGQDLNVIFDKGVVSIGKNTFNGAGCLANVTFYKEGDAGDIRMIGDNAFKGCTKLINVELPAGITSLGNDAFANCTSFNNITVPATLTNLGTAPFRGCVSLNGIDVSPENANYASEQGVLFNKSMTVLIRYPSGFTNEYTVPDGVTIIRSYAFESSSILRSVIFTSVTTIESHAFENCTGLRSVEFPAKLKTFGEYAFHGCTSLTNITFFGTPTSFGAMSFALGIPSKQVNCNVRSESSIRLDLYSDSNTKFTYSESPFLITFTWANEGITIIECGRNQPIVPPADPPSYSDGRFTYTFSHWKGFEPGMIATKDMTFSALYLATASTYRSPSGVDVVYTFAPVDSSELRISERVLMDLHDDVWKGKVSAAVVKLDDGSIELSSGALLDLPIKETLVSMKRLGTSEIPEKIAEAVKGAPVYSINFGDTHQFSGNLVIVLNYALGSFRSDDLAIWNVKTDGSHERIECSCTDENVTFNTDHLSYFSVVIDSGGGRDDPVPAEEMPVFVYIIAGVAVVGILGGIIFFMKRR